MTRLIVTAVVAFGCGAKAREELPSAAPPPSISRPPVAPARGSQYGSCDLKVSGAFEIERHVDVDLMLTDVYVARWSSSPPSGRSVFYIQCGAFDDNHANEVGLIFKAAHGTRPDAIPQRPADYPVVYYDDDTKAKPGEILGLLTEGEAMFMYGASSGALHVTRFERGELAANWDVEMTLQTSPPKRVRVTGAITYHCASPPCEL